MTDTTTDAATGATVEMVRWLLDRRLSTEVELAYLLASHLPAHERTALLCAHIDDSGRWSEFAAAAAEEEARRREREARRRDPLAAEDEDEQFLRELEEMEDTDRDDWDGVWPADRGPALEVAIGMIDRGASRCSVAALAATFVGYRTTAEVLAGGIDAAGRAESFGDETGLAVYRRSPSRAALRAGWLRGGDEVGYLRVRAVRFLERDGVPRLAEVVCGQIDDRGDTADFRAMCERMLAVGVREGLHDFLEEREWMSKDVANWFIEEDGVFRNFTGYLEHRPEADVAEDGTAVPFRRPTPGSPGRASGTTSLDALGTLVAAGVFSERAARGFAVHYLEWGEDRLLDLLCGRFDAAGLAGELAEFLGVIGVEPPPA